MAVELIMEGLEIIFDTGDDAIAFYPKGGRYFAGMVDEDVFINAFNVRFKDGERDDARAIKYFCETYGFEPLA